MSMNKKLLLISISFFSVAIFGVLVIADKGRSAAQPADGSGGQVASGIILYYGDGCPHCAIVEKFVAENDVEGRLSFVKKEVYNNRQNADDLVAKAQICGLPTDSIGVPFLWDGSSCLLGDQDIIEFFRTKAGRR